MELEEAQALVNVKAPSATCPACTGTVWAPLDGMRGITVAEAEAGPGGTQGNVSDGRCVTWRPHFPNPSDRLRPSGR